MNPMPLPDLDYATLPVPASADFQAVVKALADVPGCEPQPDKLGNMQGVYRIDHEDGSYLLTYPAAADPAVVAATFSAVTPPPEPSPLIGQRAIFVETLAAADAGNVALSAPDRAGMEVAIAYIDEKIGAAP